MTEVRKHQQYLIEHRSMVYTDLVLSGKLYSYLADIDTQARKMIDLLVTQLAEKEGVHEGLKLSLIHISEHRIRWYGSEP